MLACEMENIFRMRATLRWYRTLLPELGEDYDAILPARVRHNRIDYLYEPACRVCGCTDLHACEGGCYWVEPDLCSQCAARGGIHQDRERTP